MTTAGKHKPTFVADPLLNSFRGGMAQVEGSGSSGWALQDTLSAGVSHLICKHRLELFSDAVIAIVITVMLIELHPPEEAGWKVWLPMAPSLLAYLLGFVLVAFAWVAHHQTFARTRIISGGMLAANFGFLFLLSLMPLIVQGIARHPRASAPALQVVLCGYLQVQMMTVFRLLGRKQHCGDEGYAAWAKKRNRMGLIGIPQVCAVLIIAVFWPVVADVLIAGFSLIAVFNWM